MFLVHILFSNMACEFVPHLAGKKVRGAAYCTARGRLPLVALQTLLTRCTVRMSTTSVTEARSMPAASSRWTVRPARGTLYRGRWACRISATGNDEVLANSRRVAASTI